MRNMAARNIRVCYLNADYCVPAVQATRAPTYGSIFHHLLCAAAKESPSGTTISSQEFDVIRGEYPESLDHVDAIVVSGSASSSYDDLPWIKRLDQFIRHVYDNFTSIKIFGSCFGHQIMCQSILREYGVRTEVDPNGWEIGVKDITLNKGFRDVFGHGLNEAFGAFEIPETLRLQFVHHDHVVVPRPETLPATWMMLGSTEHCAVQGVYEPGRILTYQGHFEFDKFVNSETVKYFFPTWHEEVLKEALDAIDADDDSITAACMVLRFFLEDGQKIQSRSPETAILLNAPIDSKSEVDQANLEHTNGLSANTRPYVEQIA
ncbi:hypothetical protein ACN47E_002564 [Coniothyrium glycines]